tara:strand:- start:5010 stop:6056 length:1047 start_codon:yes stop_codon:yes gene_type:complete
MNTAPAILQTTSFISVTFLDKGTPKLVSSSNTVVYNEVKKLIADSNWSELRERLFPEDIITEVSNGELVIKDGICLYQDKPVHNVVVSRIFECITNDLPYLNLAAFLECTLKCDSYDVLNELYLFLESNETMPINADGSFFAYRVVDSNYMSKHANKDGTHNRNKVGDVLEMPRNQVNPNRNQTCEGGLHFCSFDYISFYGWSSSDRVMIVKVFPQDVITIPNDYNNAKGRCCKYEVVGECEDYNKGDTNFEIEAKATLEEARQDDVDVPVVATTTEALSYTAAEGDKVRNIIDVQLPDADSVSTARRVSKSTSNPYVSVGKVIKIALDLGFDVVLNESTSKSTISHK